MDVTWYRNVFNRKGSSFSFLIWKTRCAICSEPQVMKRLLPCELWLRSLAVIQGFSEGVVVMKRRSFVSLIRHHARGA